MHSLVSFFLLTVEIIPPTTSSDRLLGLICLLMFFAGIGLAYPEVVRRWKARMERFFAPLLRRLITLTYLWARSATAQSRPDTSGK